MQIKEVNIFFAYWWNKGQNSGDSKTQEAYTCLQNTKN